MISKTKMSQLVRAARGIDYHAQPMRLEDFAATELGLNPLQAQQCLDVQTIANLGATLTKEREKLLFVNCMVPDFVVYLDRQNREMIAGLGGFIHDSGGNPSTVSRLISRLADRKILRNTLRGLSKGHYLEAVSAAILDAELKEGYATQGASDQGIDAYGWSVLFELNEAFVEADNRSPYAPDAMVFAFASAKKSEKKTGDVKLIGPAAIRETIGGWAIQRSESGTWKQLGVKMLSPVQMVFATTYRVSSDSRLLCKEMGVQIWGLPELIYLVACHAPNSVFTPNSIFNKAEFDKWWKKFHNNRRSA